MSCLQNKVQQCITIRHREKREQSSKTETVGDRNTRTAKTTRVGQHRMLDDKNVLYVSF